MDRKTRNYLIGGIVIVVAAILIFVLKATVGPHAESLGQVKKVWLDSNICQSGIGQEVTAHGYSAAGSSQRADGVLEVKVSPIESSVGRSAAYTAKLTGDGGKLLFETSGEESSVSEEELCKDIGDDILDSLDSKKGG